MKNLIALTLLLGGSTLLCAQKPAKTPATYKPVKSEMYRKGWIDFNKNGVKDVYEDPSAPLEARIENLLQQTATMQPAHSPGAMLPVTDIHWTTDSSR